MIITVWGAKGNVGRHVAEICRQRGHEVIEIDLENAEQLADERADNKGAANQGTQNTAIGTDNNNGGTNQNAECAQDGGTNKQHFSASNNKKPAPDTQTKRLSDSDTRPDVVINFSVPSATQDVARYCSKHHCALVDGVTGRTPQQAQLLHELAQDVPVLHSNNFSQGAALLNELAEHAAKAVPWDCEITELHRKGKQDSPGGTAKQIAATVVQARGGFAAATIHSLRCGNCCGTHTVVFGGDGERVEITHVVESRAVFALGAVIQAEKMTRK